MSIARQKIAILAWGSLLWERNRSFDDWHEDWRHDGPILPLEFSRISSTRFGALTLVIDQQNGSLTTVAWSLSKRPDLDDAVADLRCRESCAIKKIARLTLPPLRADSSHPEESIIGEWATDHKVDAVIWTALDSNFERKHKETFTVEHAITYLKELLPEAKVRAAEYVWRAPPFVRTPLRDALQREPWFAEPRSISPTAAPPNSA